MTGVSLAGSGASATAMDNSLIYLSATSNPSITEGASLTIRVFAVDSNGGVSPKDIAVKIDSSGATDPKTL